MAWGDGRCGRGVTHLRLTRPQAPIEGDIEARRGDQSGTRTLIRQRRPSTCGDTTASRPRRRPTGERRDALDCRVAEPVSSPLLWLLHYWLPLSDPERRSAEALGAAVSWLTALRRAEESICDWLFPNWARPNATAWRGGSCQPGRTLLERGLLGEATGASECR